MIMIMASAATSVFCVILVIMAPSSLLLSFASISSTTGALLACPRPTNPYCTRNRFHRDTAALHASSQSSIPHLPLDTTHASTNASGIFDAVVNARYACTRFRRHQEPQNDNNIDMDNNNAAIISSTMTSEPLPPQPIASISNPQIIQIAYQSLLLSQRAPSGFNAQPYRIVLVHSRSDKEKVAQYCLGRNADRVRDSDCTAIFLADARVGYDGQRYTNLLKRHTNGEEKLNDDSKRNATSTTTSNLHIPSATSKTTKATTRSSNKYSSSRSRRSLTPRELLKVRLLVLLFSSGYPLPSLLSVPLSFIVRLGVSILATIVRWLHSTQQRLIPLLPCNTTYRTINSNNNIRLILSRLLSSFIRHRKLQLLPTLYTSQTWSQKNTMLVAMTYILSCTSHGLVTCPMEGFDAVGIKKVLGVKPMRRYSIPLLVSTGMPYHDNNQDRNQERVGEEEATMTTTDDAGLSHGRGALLSPRYPPEEVVYENVFGMPFQQ